MKTAYVDWTWYICFCNHIYSNEPKKATTKRFCELKKTFWSPTNCSFYSLAFSVLSILAFFWPRARRRILECFFASSICNTTFTSVGINIFHCWDGLPRPWKKKRCVKTNRKYIFSQDATWYKTKYFYARANKRMNCWSCEIRKKINYILDTNVQVHEKSQ